MAITISLMARFGWPLVAVAVVVSIGWLFVYYGQLALSFFGSR